MANHRWLERSGWAALVAVGGFFLGTFDAGMNPWVCAITAGLACMLGPGPVEQEAKEQRKRGARAAARGRRRRERSAL